MEGVERKNCNQNGPKITETFVCDLFCMHSHLKKKSNFGKIALEHTHARPLQQRTVFYSSALSYHHHHLAFFYISYYDHIYNYGLYIMQKKPFFWPYFGHFFLNTSNNDNHKTHGTVVNSNIN